MRWRREDTAYAAATSVVGVLVVYLVAGNFGLIPSPLAPLDPGNGATVRIPRVLALPAGTDEVAEGRTDSVGSLIPIVSPPAADTRAPSVTIEPPAAPVVVAASQDAVMGSASDDVSGIARVVVTYVGTVGEMSPVYADLVCSSPPKCTWSAGAPAAADSYEVRAEAFDRAGRRAVSDTVTLTVISAPPTASGGPHRCRPQLPVAA